DVATRAADLGAHYSDAGIAPRRDVLDEFAFLHDQAISLHLMGGSAAFEALHFAAAGLAAIALLFGYPTRSATRVRGALGHCAALRLPDTNRRGRPLGAHDLGPAPEPLHRRRIRRASPHAAP